MDRRLFTPAEAGAASGLSLKAVNNAIDKKIVEPMRQARGRRLSTEDIVRLRVWHGVGAILSAERRRQLFAEMDAQPRAKTLKADDLVIVDVGAARRQVEAGLRALAMAETMVHSDKEIMGGEPVFKGTRVPVRMIAEIMAAGADADEMLEGYPSIDRARLELATIWAAAHPSRGRPKNMRDLGYEPISTVRVPIPPDPLPGIRNAGGSACDS